MRKVNGAGWKVPRRSARWEIANQVWLLPHPSWPFTTRTREPSGWCICQRYRRSSVRTMSGLDPTIAALYGSLIPDSTTAARRAAAEPLRLAERVLDGMKRRNCLATSTSA